MSWVMRTKNMPKLILRRSWLYDQALARKRGYKMPSDRVLDVCVQKLGKEWVRYGEKVLKEISRITKLDWQEKEIVCYVTAGVIPYSDPLTLNLRSDIDTLTHELIHRILSEPENWKRIKSNWMRLMKKYRNEAQKTKTHIIVHAIHAAILKKLFGEKRLEKAKKTVRDSKYIRSWTIVDADGYGNIVKELTKGLT